MKWILLLLFSVSAFSATTTHKTDKLKLGRNQGEDIFFFADTGAVSLPYLFFDFSEGVWKKSDDGVTSTPLGGQSPITTEGDLIVGNASGEESRLAIGTVGQILSSTGTTANWIDFVPSPTTTQGDLIFRGPTTDERLALGGPNQLLTASLGGPIWADPPVSTTVSAKGDIQTHDGVQNESLGVGNDGDFLVADSNEITGLKWSDQLQGVLNPITNFTPYNPTITNLGTVSEVNFEWKQIGDEIRIKGDFRIGTIPATGIATLSLPPGITANTSVAGLGVGDWRHETTSTSPNKSGTFQVNTTFIQFADDQSTTASSGTAFSAPNASVILNDNSRVTVNITIKTNELSSGVDAVVQNKTLTAATDNYCTGFIPANGSAVFRENYSGCINVTKISAGIYRLNHSAMSLTNVPSIMANSMDIGSGIICGQDNAFSNTTTETQVICRNTSNSLTDTNFMYKITKVEDDYNKAIVIAGTFGKCQTKFLSADVSSNTASMTDLRFQNLNTSSFYSITLNASFVYSVGNTCTMYANDGVQDLLVLQNREADGNTDRTIDTSTNPFFSPGSSTVNVGMVEVNSCILEGNGTFSETWVTMCEVNKSQTTEW